MLDAKELAERLRAAMDLREPPLGLSELARRCGVTKQAVYEWRTTGRMGKAHLVTVAQETGMPLEYFLEPERGSSTATKAIWRKLGKAFAKVAMLWALALAFLFTPAPAEAGRFDISVSLFNDCIRKLLNFWKRSRINNLLRDKFTLRTVFNTNLTTT